MNTARSRRFADGFRSSSRAGPALQAQTPTYQTLLTTQTPTLDNADDGTDYTFGLLFSSDINATVAGVRWWAPSGGVASPVNGLLYSHDSEAAGTLLASKPFGAITPGGWNNVLFDSPVAITAGQLYVAARWSADHHYVATGNFFHDAPLTNGHLTGYLDADPHRNGRFVSGAGAPSYPTGAFNGGNYFVDVLVTG